MIKEEPDDLEPFDFKECMDYLGQQNWEEMVRISEEDNEMHWARRHAEELNPHSDVSF